MYLHLAPLDTYTEKGHTEYKDVNSSIYKVYDTQLDLDDQGQQPVGDICGIVSSRLAVLSPMVTLYGFGCNISFLAFNKKKRLLDLVPLQQFSQFGTYLRACMCHEVLHEEIKFVTFSNPLSFLLRLQLDSTQAMH